MGERKQVPQIMGHGFGTAMVKLFRRNANDNSVESAMKIDTKKMEQLVYETIKSFPDGCIQDQILDTLKECPYPSVTARFKALKDKGYIEVVGSRQGRSGRNQSIYKAKQ